MNQDEAKRAAYSLTYGLYAITSRWGEAISGMTAIWVTQISKEPIQVAVGLTPDSVTAQMILKSQVFAVNVLAPKHKELAYAFGRQSSDQVQKFDDLETESRQTGAPILKDAVAYLDCRVTSVTPVGSHLLIVGEVVEAARLREDTPAVYRNGSIF